MTGWRWIAAGGLFASTMGTVFVWALCQAAARGDRLTNEEHSEGYLDRLDQMIEDDERIRDRRPR